MASGRGIANDRTVNSAKVSILVLVKYGLGVPRPGALLPLACRCLNSCSGEVWPRGTVWPLGPGTDPPVVSILVLVKYGLGDTSQELGVSIEDLVSILVLV